MTRSVRVLQNTVNAGQTRFTGTVSELSPTAEPHILAVYQNQLWLSAILGSGENATTVWVPLGRAGMVKTHVQDIPIFTWNVANVFGSTNVTVQAFDEDGYVYSPSIKVEEDFITVMHTEAKAGRLVIISADNLFSGAPDTGIRYIFATTFAGFPGSGDAETIYVARDTDVAYYFDSGAYHAFGTAVEVVNNLTTNDGTKALSAAQGVALKALADTKLAVSDVVDNVVTQNSTQALSATQGFVLKGLVDSLELAKLDAADVVDGLTSTDATQALSANQGRVLKGLIDTINSVLQSDDGTLNELQEIVDYIKLNRAELDALNIASIAGLQDALDLKANISQLPVQYVNFLTGSARDVFYSQDRTVLASIPQGLYHFTALASSLGIPSSAFMAISVVVFGTTNKSLSFVAQENATRERYTRHCRTITSNGVDNNVVWDSDWLSSLEPTIDNVVSNGSLAPLAANQGYVLKQLVDGLEASKVATSDVRLTNAREWTATTVTQLEAETGTDTTRRAWTAQRVFQAIAAWWATSAFKTKLDGIEAGAQVNVPTDLTLGTLTATTLPVLSSTGADVTLPAATTSLAGLMSSADKTSLDNLASGVSAGTLLNKYSLLLGTSTGAVNLSTSQVWKITDPGSTRTISIANPPAATRSMSVVLQVIGNRATNWPAGIQWADGLAPVLAANWTMIILTYIDGVVYGSVGPSA